MRRDLPTGTRVRLLSAADELPVASDSPGRALILVDLDRDPLLAGNLLNSLAESGLGAKSLVGIVTRSALPQSRDPWPFTPRWIRGTGDWNGLRDLVAEWTSPAS